MSTTSKLLLFFSDAVIHSLIAWSSSAQFLVDVNVAVRMPRPGRGGRLAMVV